MICEGSKAKLLLLRLVLTPIRSAELAAAKTLTGLTDEADRYAIYESRSRTDATFVVDIACLKRNSKKIIPFWLTPNF